MRCLKQGQDMGIVATGKVWKDGRYQFYTDPDGHWLEDREIPPCGDRHVKKR